MLTWSFTSMIPKILKEYFAAWVSCGSSLIRFSYPGWVACMCLAVFCAILPTTVTVDQTQPLAGTCQGFINWLTILSKNSSFPPCSFLPASFLLPPFLINPSLLPSFLLPYYLLTFPCCLLPNFLPFGFFYPTLNSVASIPSSFLPPFFPSSSFFSSCFLLFFLPLFFTPLFFLQPFLLSPFFIPLFFLPPAIHNLHLYTISQISPPLNQGPLES